MEEAVEVVAEVNVFMYVWKAVHGGGGASWLEADSDSLCFLSDQPWINLRLRPHLGMNLQHRSVHTYTHKHTQTFPHYNVCICLQTSTERRNAPFCKESLQINSGIV